MRAVNFRWTYRAFLTRLEMGVEISKTINRIDALWSERGTESERGGGGEETDKGNQAERQQQRVGQADSER